MCVIKHCNTPHAPCKYSKSGSCVPGQIVNCCNFMHLEKCIFLQIELNLLSTNSVVLQAENFP